MDWSQINGTAFPTFSKDLLKYTPGQINDHGHRDVGSWGFNNPHANTTMNDVWFREQGIPAWMFNGSNIDFQGDESGLAGIKIKTGDKEGTVVPYKLVDGQYVPDLENARTQAWNSNIPMEERLALMGAAAGFTAPLWAPAVAGAVGSVGGATSGAGAGTTGTVGTPGATGAAASASLPAAQFAALDAAQLAAQGLGASQIQATLMATGVDAFMAADIAQLAAQGLSAASITQNAATAYGSGLNALGGATGAGAGMFDINWTDLAKKYGPDVLDYLRKAGPSLIDSATSGINAAKNESYVDSTLALNNRYAADFKQAGDEYATGLLGLKGQYADAFKPRYATASNGFATSNIDPATGKVSYTLSQPYQGARDRYLDSASQVMGQAGSFDPKAHAAERFASAQALLQPGRTTAQQGLLQELMNKGGYGLSLNGQAADGSEGSTNPYLSTFLAANNRQDAEMAYSSLREGESYLDGLLRRSDGLFRAGAQVDQWGQPVLADARNWTTQFNADRQNEAGFGFNLDEGALRAKRDGTQQYLTNVLQAQRDALTWDRARQGGMLSSINAGTPTPAPTAGRSDWVSALPWQKIGGWLFG
jgi:hypothetical protein